MRHFSWLLIVPLLLAAASAHAERIYRLVDYPDLQNGHTLSGTITTTDDAPDDGLLHAGEIVAWEWSSTGPSVGVIYADHKLDPAVSALDISISAA
ncbi:MAG: hypothetical protein KDA37_05525, partial [Planctomycetales bacterium]|nr:hypothetical protein [Planctomycetales bacterium]